MKIKIHCTAVVLLNFDSNVKLYPNISLCLFWNFEQVTVQLAYFVRNLAAFNATCSYDNRIRRTPVGSLTLLHYIDLCLQRCFINLETTRPWRHRCRWLNHYSSEKYENLNSTTINKWWQIVLEVNNCWIMLLYHFATICIFIQLHCLETISL